ncbi:DivIVA domain-containing protein [Streptomyces fradiae]|uniref:DivIVA domain-containing protein n=1 Tax=Streptomyces fradiae TaxID=1906 RepID=UPI0021894EA8|nr:DivIVA domain-containing protein [Streptomyces fradiae]
MFWFLAVAMVVVVAAVTLAVVGGAENEVLPEAPPEHLADPLPLTRPVTRADVEAVRLPLAARGYRMAEVDDVLDRLAAELAERDARIAELESALAGAQATASGRADLFAKHPAPGPAAGTRAPAEAPAPPVPPVPPAPPADGPGAADEGAAQDEAAAAGQDDGGRGGPGGPVAAPGDRGERGPGEDR